MLGEAASTNDPPCAPISVTYTLDGDFSLGVLNGVVMNSDQLELSQTPTTWPFAWIANGIEGTLSKVDTQTGREVARYYTGPWDGTDYAYLSPSRTVVDKDGACWVANRTYGNYLPSVTQIVMTGGIDRNNNNVIDTSTDLNNNGVIDPAEILPWGQDERVIRHYALGSTLDNGARGLIIDKTGFLWVGLTSSQEVMKINPNLSTVTYAPTNSPVVAPPLVNLVLPGTAFTYGMALSPNGLIYISTAGDKAIQLDPGLASGGTGAGPAFTEFITHGGAHYGITVDQNCIVWLALASSPDGNAGVVRWDPPLTAGNPLNGWTYNTGTVGLVGRGITVDFNGDIWMSLNGAQDSVIKFGPGPNPPILGVYPVGVATPCGVGISSDGNVIVTPNGSSNWEKLDVNTGANIPLAGPQTVGPGPYTYSDFTGSLMNMNGFQQGTWSVVTDGGSTQTAWNFIGWNQLTPPLTSVQVEYRIAQTLPALSIGSWITIGSPGNPGPVLGRYIETRVRLQRTPEGCGQPFVTPVLYDLTVAADCDSCGFTACPPDTVIPCLTPEGAEFFYDAPTLVSLCDSTYVISCSPPPGFFPLGPTLVTCIAVNAQDDTVSCSFTVTVAGNCDPPPTGACCNGVNCYLTTEHDCKLQGGVYFGNNTTCIGGCSQNCAHAPNNLRAWWPFDEAPGGVTPNLAGLATGGLLIGSPTPVIGSFVNNAYAFDGVSQYVQAPHHEGLDLGASDFTLDAWIRTSQDTGIATLIDKRSAAPVQGFSLFLSDGYPGLQLAVGGSFDEYVLNAASGVPGAFVADDAWHLLAVTVDRDSPDGVQFYVDGVPAGSPFDPTLHQGSIDNGEPLYLAAENPSLGSRRFAGIMDEVEIFRRALAGVEIGGIWNSGSSGKCPEACIVTQNVPCCGGFSGASSVTICNYTATSHTYSWGATTLYGGAGCAPQGPIGFSPAAGTVTVPAYGCVTIPIYVACPSTVPPGQVACYQVSVFNHDTGRIFGCQGSVRRVPKWCIFADPVGVGTVGVLQLPAGVATVVPFDVENLDDSGTPQLLSYQIQVLAGDTGLPSEVASLDGLPPGAPVTGNLLLGSGASDQVSVSVAYDAPWPIGHDRLVLSGDEDGDGTAEILGEVALLSVDASALAVPGDRGGEERTGNGRLFLALPNPFAASDQIRFRVEGDRGQEVSLRLFDLLGREVKEFPMGGPLPAGEYTVNWDTRDERGLQLATGIYFLRLDIGGVSETVKVLVRR